MRSTWPTGWVSPTPPSTTRSAASQRDGLVHSEPYRSIFLTSEGRDLADHCRRRHLIVYRFLRSLGVGEEVARVDAEGIEHHVSDETLAAFDRLLRERDRNGEGG